LNQYPEKTCEIGRRGRETLQSKKICASTLLLGLDDLYQDGAARPVYGLCTQAAA